METKVIKKGYHIIIKNLKTGEEVNETVDAIIGAYAIKTPKEVKVQSIAAVSGDTATFIATIKGTHKVASDCERKVINRVLGDCFAD